MLNKEYLQTIFIYKDGNLYWKIAKSNAIKIGSEAGNITSKGYRNIQVNKKIYGAHRLVFLMHNGYLPNQIDHIDGNKLNNNIDNLREATNAQNQCNIQKRSNNTSGFKNVYLHKKTNKWQVRLQINGKPKCFGLYHDIDYAKFVSDAMRNKHHGKYANHG
jgi:hypothetical protein